MFRREEQVEIFSAEDHKMIQSTFTVGPLTLDVTKTVRHIKINLF